MCFQPITDKRQKEDKSEKSSKADISELRDNFSLSIDKKLSRLQVYSSSTAAERYFRDAIHRITLNICGKKEKNPDWFVAGFAKMEPIIEEKGQLS